MSSPKDLKVKIAGEHFGSTGDTALRLGKELETCVNTVN